MQLFVWVNPTGAVILVSVTDWLPLFTRRAVCGGLVVPAVCTANVNWLGVKVRDPPVSTPFPVTVMFWVPAPSVIDISEVRTPTAVGVKVI